MSRTYKVATEHAEQRSLFTWAALHRHKYPQLQNMFAVPNGGWRHPATAAMLKAEGVKSGVPDIFLAWPSGNHHGLFIEMKRLVGSKVSEDQKEWASRLSAAGYLVVTCKGFDHARETIEFYLGEKR